MISRQILEIQPSYPFFEYAIAYMFTIFATTSVYYINLRGEWKKPPITFMKTV
ncbi:hypothetical protein LEP1GSC123_2435 [Leptospira borgpetersenii str. 200701203]|uniref:Uncharacterized protein n=1 Tax=Leptospira borgpetersenii str. 200701203 TaxID=1193007 RepID=M3GGZ9_LEPBO|nr:hypothetical protein LEP1GSC123_2435 [Leptospira borgpetersenii str. 200701203]